MQVLQSTLNRKAMLVKNVFFLLFLSFSLVTYSQVITGEELQLMVESAQKNCVGAHESIVLRTNENLAKTIWGKNVRLNEVVQLFVCKIIKPRLFFSF